MSKATSRWAFAGAASDVRYWHKAHNRIMRGWPRSHGTMRKRSEAKRKRA